MQTKYKLSICIPTYNRAKYLPELLDSILSQPEASKVEIAISDNASTDNTEDLIKAYQEKHKNIVYLKLIDNLGPDRNYFKAVEISSGVYVWLMGSDDKLAEGALSLVLHEIESGKDIYLQDRIECDVDMNVLKHRTWWVSDTKSSWDFKKDNIEDYFECCVSLGGVFSYLSSIVVKRDAWNKFYPEDKYFSTAYSHVFTLLSIIKHKGSLELIKTKKVLCRGGNDHFGKNGWCQRVLIDFFGYKKLEEDLKFNNLMLILKREHGIIGVSALYEGCISDAEAKNYLLISGFTFLDIIFAKLRAYLKKIYKRYIK